MGNGKYCVARTALPWLMRERGTFLTACLGCSMTSMRQQETEKRLKDDGRLC